MLTVSRKFEIGSYCQGNFVGEVGNHKALSHCHVFYLSFFFLFEKKKEEGNKM